MKTIATIGAAALLLSSASALAQETPDTGSKQGGVAEAGLPPVEGSDIPADAGVSHEGTTHQEGTAATSDASANFTPAQIDGYAAAAMEVQEMQADTSLDDAAQQERAAAILAGAGLDPATFNAISDAARRDPAVAERVQLAMANRRGSPGA